MRCVKNPESIRTISKDINYFFEMSFDDRIVASLTNLYLGDKFNRSRIISISNNFKYLN